jgi:hypothetical protein
MNLPLKECYGHKYHVAHPSIQCRADAEGAEVFTVKYKADHGYDNDDFEWVPRWITADILVLAHEESDAKKLLTYSFVDDNFL